MFDWPTCVVFYFVFHNIADFIESNCLLAIIKHFFIHSGIREVPECAYCVFGYFLDMTENCSLVLIYVCY